MWGRHHLVMESTNNRNNQHWTVKEKSLLIQLRKDGLTEEQMASQIGRTCNAINEMGIRLGIALKAPKPWTEDEMCLLKKLKAEGLTTKQMMGQLKRTNSAIKNMCRKLKITLRSFPRHWTTDEKSLLKKLRAEGVTTKKIAIQTGRTVTAIRVMCAKLGIVLTKNYKLLSLYYFRSIKRGADDRNLEFCITPKVVYSKFVEQGGRCALSGCPIFLNPKLGDNHKQTASLDRIDSTKGYLLDNIQWVHKDINMLKRNFGEECFRSMCLAVAKTIELDEFIYEDSWEAKQPSTKLVVD